MNFDVKFGFTLIELAVVLLIVGILVVVSVPTYQLYVTRSKTAEAYQTIGTMINQQKTYFSENKQFVTLLWNPTFPLHTSPWRVWSPISSPIAPGSYSNFNYSTSAGRNNEQWNPDAPSTLTSGWNLTSSALYAFTSTNNGSISEQKAGCSGTPTGLPATAGGGQSGEGRTDAVFNPASFGVQQPSSGIYDWVVLMAQGNLNNSPNTCKYVGLALEANTANGSSGTPNIATGFIQFDYNYDNRPSGGSTGATMEDSPPDTDP